jgi:hypothetical protein
VRKATEWNHPVVDGLDLDVRRHVYFSIVAEALQ